MATADDTDFAMPVEPRALGPLESPPAHEAGAGEPPAPGLGAGPGFDAPEALAGPQGHSSAWGRFVDLVRFEQTVFALPFAYSGVVLAAHGLPSFKTFFWITLAMVGARTAGMGANRLIDRHLDARNPRTADRALPAGRISVSSVVALTATSLALLVLSAAMLNPLCLALSPLAVALLVGYSYLKRFTWACHLGLGAVQACAPLGGWLGVTGEFAPAPLALGAAIFFWVAGFDVLYACQDLDVDRRDRLFSIPARLGARRAFLVARAFHGVALAALTAAGLLLGLGTVYYAGVGLVGAVLVWEHSILAPDDLSRMQQAFFVANAVVSVTLLVAVLLEVLL